MRSVSYPVFLWVSLAAATVAMFAAFANAIAQGVTLI